jgi:nicotinamide N-methyltransferase
VAWNAGKWLAHYFDQHPHVCRDAWILELGAGAALPSMTACLNGAAWTVATDFPDQELIDMLQLNMNRNIPVGRQHAIQARGYLWGSDPCALFQGMPEGQKFTILILCDLVFNHSQHDNLIQTCLDCLAPNGVMYCIFTHHRPWMSEKDMEFTRRAQEHFELEEYMTEKVDVMFEKDPGDEQVRQTLHVFRFLRRGK